MLYRMPAGQYSGAVQGRGTGMRYKGAVQRCVQASEVWQLGTHGCRRAAAQAKMLNGGGLRLMSPSSWPAIPHINAHSGPNTQLVHGAVYTKNKSRT